MILEMIGLFEKRATMVAFEGPFSAVDDRVPPHVRSARTDVRTIGTPIRGSLKRGRNKGRRERGVRQARDGS